MKISASSSQKNKVQKSSQQVKCPIVVLDLCTAVIERIGQDTQFSKGRENQLFLKMSQRK